MATVTTVTEPCLLLDDEELAKQEKTIQWRTDSTALKAARVFGSSKQQFPNAFHTYTTENPNRAFPFFSRGGGGSHRGGRGGAVSAPPRLVAPVPAQEEDPPYAACTPPVLAHPAPASPGFACEPRATASAPPPLQDMSAPAASKSTSEGAA